MPQGQVRGQLKLAQDVEWTGGYLGPLESVKAKEGYPDEEDLILARGLVQGSTSKSPG